MRTRDAKESRPAKPRSLQWEISGTTLVALTGSRLYRVVYSNGYQCLRLEETGKEFRWLGQFASLDQAKAQAQVHENGERRLKAWEDYMRRNDPPAEG